MVPEPPVNILLVDDHVGNLLALQAVLSEPSWNVVSASSGKEALRNLLATDFAVILLDVQMPEMDGIETAALIRQRDRTRSTPIIFLTGHDDEGVLARKGYAVGAVDYLRKPPVPAVLRAKVAVFVELYRKTEQIREVKSTLRLANSELEQQVGRRNVELADAVRGLAERTTQLAATNRDLVQKNSENEAFVYSVSHDLRSPLVNLQGFSKELDMSCRDLRGLMAEANLPDVLRQRILQVVDDDMGQSIHFIQSAVTRLSNIIDALLRLSRAGRLVPQWQSVDLNGILSRIVASLAGTIAERGAQVHVGPLPVVWGDAVSVERVFANLLVNALAYIDPARSGVIEVGSIAGPQHADSHSDRHTLFVRDNGLGISAAAQAKVFQAFQRFHPDRAEGEGMGLTIAQRLIERHGGQIWFESTAGTGTTFFVTLPSLPPAERPIRKGEEQLAGRA